VDHALAEADLVERLGGQDHAGEAELVGGGGKDDFVVAGGAGADDGGVVQALEEDAGFAVFAEGHSGFGAAAGGDVGDFGGFCIGGEFRSELWGEADEGLDVFGFYALDGDGPPPDGLDGEVGVGVRGRVSAGTVAEL